MFTLHPWGVGLVAESAPSRLGIALLLLSILIAAGCAIVYELLIASISSYFLGDSVEQFSLTIGFFLFAMGLGAWLSRLLQDNLLQRFIQVELALGLVGGSSVAFLYVFYAYTEHFRYGMLLLIILIGSLIGLEVPLLTRILRQYGTLRTALSSVLSMDYFGSLFAALLFPYLLLPFLGAMHTSILTGLVNWVVGVVVFFVFRHQLDRSSVRWLGGQTALSGLTLLALLLLSQPLLDRWESNFYEDPVVYEEQSRYQKIVLTSRGEHVRLYLNGHLQFASIDEYRYHEALVHPAMALSASRQRVLIIGGGDGLTAREVLKYEDVESVELVDLDPAITRLAQRNPHLTRLNGNALNRQRVEVINLDGFLFLQEEHAPYGVIILDLPDPREEGLAKLYSLESYRLARRLLAPGGIIVTQATSPYFAREAFWCIGQTMEEAGLQILSYHLNVPSFGEWGFHLGAARSLDAEKVRFGVPRLYLDEPTWLAALVFGRDMARVPTQINELDKPALARYYRRGWNEWF